MTASRVIAGTTPKFLRVKNSLLQMIDQDLNVGAVIPSEREVADLYDVSRMTARKAIEQLVQEGRVSRHVGRGTFVTQPAIQLTRRMTSFSYDMLRRGSVPGSLEIFQTLELAGKRAADNLHVSAQEKVVRFLRVRMANGEPIAIEDVRLLSQRLPVLLKEDLSNQSLYDILASRYGVVFDGGEETISAEVASPEDSELLHIPVGAPMLVFLRVSTCRGERIEFSVSKYRADRYELSAAFSPGGRGENDVSTI